MAPDVSADSGESAGTARTDTAPPQPQEVSGAGDNDDGAASGVAEKSAEKSPAGPAVVKTITLKSGRDKGVDVEVPRQDAADTPRYLVQVASFSSEKNANALAARLRAQNLPVMMDVVERVAGLLHRVRVGPYEERSEADAVVAGLKSQMQDLQPRILDLRPDESAPVSTPSDPLVRWVVQVGSFGTEKPADELVARLRLAGLSAFSEKVTSDAGAAYKVRVGPELDRDKAVALARQLKTEHKLEGFVTTQE